MSYLKDRYRRYFYGKRQLRRGAAALIAAAGLFAAPLYAEAADASKITDSSGKTLIGSEKVHDLYAHDVKDDIAVSRYKDFTLAQNEIANMYFHRKDATAEGSHLVNLVDSRIDINGTVNAIKGNRLGGEIFFLSPDGIAIGKTGVINAGAVDLIVPTRETFDHLCKDYEGSRWGDYFKADTLRGIGKFGNGDNPRDSADDPGISVNGRINARSGILLGATKIDIATGAELKSRKDIDFTNLVNVNDAGGSIVADANLSGVGMKVTTDDKTGDIVLKAHVEHIADDNNIDNIAGETAATGWLPEKTTDIVARIDVGGNIAGDGNVSIKADALTTFKEGEILNVLSQTGLLDKILGGLGVDIAADWVNKTSKASVNVGEGASVTGGGALTIDAAGKIDVFLTTTTPPVKTGNLTMSLLPTTALNVALLNNQATVDIFGALSSGTASADPSKSAMNINASADTKCRTIANAATEAGEGIAPDFVYASGGVVQSDVDASVRIHGNAVVNAGPEANRSDFTAKSFAKSYIETGVTAKAPDNSLALGAVGFTDHEMNASVEVDGLVNARNITLTAEAVPDTNAVSVSGGIGEAVAGVRNPFELDGSGAIDSLLDPLLNKAKGILRIDKLSGKLSSWIPSGKTDKSFSNLMGSVLSGKFFKAGVSVNVFAQDNASSVRIGKDAVLNAQNDISIAANTHIDCMNLSATGELNSQKDSQNAKLMVAGAVLADKVENDASVVFESDGTKHARLYAGGKLDVRADAGMDYNPVTVAVGFVASKWVEFGEALETVGIDMKDDVQAIGSRIEGLGELDAVELPEAIADIRHDVREVFGAAAEALGDSTEAYRMLKEAYEYSLSLLDPATFVNYYARTQASGNSDGGSKLDATGAANLDILRSRGTILANEGVELQAKGDASLAAGTSTNTVTLSGNGGRYLTTNESSGAGLGVTAALQDVSASSLLMLGKGVSVKGANVTLAADNKMIQTDVVYGGGESQGAAALNGMIGFLMGASDSVVSVDDEAVITAAGKAAIRSDNNTVVTGIAGGATLGGAGTYAAVGAGLMTVYYDVNNYAIVSDNGKDAERSSVVLSDAEVRAIEDSVDKDITEGKLDEGSRDAEIADRERHALAAKMTLESSALQKISGGVALAHELAGDARRGMGSDTGEVSFSRLGYDNMGTGKATDATRGGVTAADFSAKATTAGVINSIAIEGTSSSNSHPAVDTYNKYIGKADTFISYLPEIAEWPMDKISKTIGGKITGKLNKGDASKKLGEVSEKANPDDSGSVSLKSEKEVQAAVRIGGAGSIALNFADGETAAIVDGVNVTAPKVSVKAEDELFKGAWAGTGAVNWYSGEKSKDSGGKSDSGSKPKLGASIGGALALNSSARSVDSLIRDTTFTNAATLENSATKSGADIAVGLGVSVAKTSASAQGSVAASVSYNMADGDIHALMIDDTVRGSNAAVENRAFNGDLQIAGSVSAGASAGDSSLSVGAGGSVAVNRISSDVESGVIGGNYTGVKSLGVDAAKAANQISAALATAFSSSKEGKSFGFTGAATANDTDNTTRAFIEGADITAGSVRVEANDALSANKFESYLESRGVDASGTDSFGENAAEQAKDPKGGVIIGAAVAGEYAGSGGGGLALTYNASRNDMIAEIGNAKITADSVTGRTTDRTVIASTGLGASMGGEYFGGVGAVSWNDIRNRNTVRFDGSDITTRALSGTSLNESKLINVTGEASIAKGVAAGFDFSFNDIDNVSGVYLAGGELSAKSSDGLALDLGTVNNEFAFALGLGVSVSTQKSALAGSMAITTGDSSAETVIGDGSGGRRTVIRDAKSVRVSADDTANKITTGGAVEVSGGGIAAVGVSAAYADIGGAGLIRDAGEKLTASIRNADITTKSGATIDVGTSDLGQLLTTAAGAGISVSENPLNLQGAVAISSIAKNAEASITGSTIDAAAGGKNAVVNVTSESKNKTLTTGVAASIAPAGGAIAAGAGISIDHIKQHNAVSVENTTANLSTLSLRSKGYSDIISNAMGVGVSSSGLGAAGSFAYNDIGSNISAELKDSAVAASGSIGVVAQSDEEISNYAGSLGGGAVGIGLGVNVNRITGDTTATVTGSTLSAKGADSGIMVSGEVDDDDIIHGQFTFDTFNPALSDKRKASRRTGVAVEASATHAIASDLASAGIAEYFGGSGTFNENFMSGSTSALMENSEVNGGTSSASAGQDVAVRAADFMNLGTFELGASGSTYAALGVTENTNLLKRDVSAAVTGKSASERSEVNAGNFSVEAVSKKGTGNFALAGTFSATGANATANVIYDGIEGSTTAGVENVNVNYGGSAKVSAQNLDRADMGLYQAAVNGIGVGIGLSAGVVQQSSETTASVVNSDIIGKNSSRLDVTADNRVEAESWSISLGFSGEGVGAAGSVFVDMFDNTVGVATDNAALYAGGVNLTADNFLKAESYGGSAAIAGLGGSMGVSTLYNSVSDKVYVDVLNNSRITAADQVDIRAGSTRDFSQLVATVSGSAFAGIAVNYMGDYINSAVDDDDLKTKIAAFNDPDTTKTFNPADFEGISDADAKQIAEETRPELSEGRDVEPGDAEGVHVRVKDSSVTALQDGTLAVTAEEKNSMKALSNADSLGIAGINSSAVNVKAKRANDITLDRAELSAKTLSVKALTTDYRSDAFIESPGLNVASAIGNAGGVTVEILDSTVKTEGSTLVDISDSNISSGGAADISAEDSASLLAGSGCVTVGIANAGGLMTQTENISEAGVAFSGANRVAADRLSVAAKKANELKSQSVSGTYTGIGTTVNKTQATDKGLSSVTISGNQNEFTAGVADFSALNAPSVRVVIDQDGGGIIAGLTSLGDIELSSGASVKADAGNTFRVDNLSFRSQVGDPAGTTADIRVSSVAVSEADMNAVGDHARIVSETKAMTDIGAENYKGRRGEEKATALTVSAETQTSREIDIWNANLGLLEVANGSIQGVSESSEAVIAQAAGGSVKSLNLSAVGNSYVDNDVVGSSGGVLAAGNLGTAKTTFDNAAKALLSGTWSLGGGDATISALQNDSVDYESFALSVGGLDCTGATAELTMNGGASAGLAKDAVLTGAKDVSFIAGNTAKVNQGGKYDCNVWGVAGAFLGFSDVTSNVGAQRRSDVTVGEKAVVEAGGGQVYDAYTDVKLLNRSHASARAELTGGDAVTLTDVSSENSVTIKKGATLTGKGTPDTGGIALAAHDNLDLTTEAEASTAGAASVYANSDATVTLRRDNTVDMAGAINGAGDVGLYAGADSGGKLSAVDNHLVSEAYNYSVIPSTSPKLTNTVDETAGVRVADVGSIRAGRDISLVAQSGNENVKTETKAWKWWGGSTSSTKLLGSVNGVSDFGQTADNTVTVDGTLVAGKQYGLYIDIDGQMVPTGATIEGRSDNGSYTITVRDSDGKPVDAVQDRIVTGTFDYGNALYTRWQQITELIRQYDGDNESLDAYSGYKAELAVVEAQMEALGLMSPEGLPISGNYRVVFVELPDEVLASGGNIRVTGDDLMGSGSMQANGSPEVKIANRSNAYLKLNDVRTDEDGGGVFFNGVSIPSEGANDVIQRENLSGEKPSLTILSDRLGADAQIDVYNEYTEGDVAYRFDGEQGLYRAVSAVEIDGEVSAPNGTVSITNNSGSVLVASSEDHPAGISGATVKIEATGSFVTGYSPEVRNIGYTPEVIYDSLAYGKGIHLDTDTNGAHAENYLTAEQLRAGRKPNDLGATVVGGSVAIWASDINVNGLIQSGYNDYTATITQAAVDRAKQKAREHSSELACTVNGKTMYEVCRDDIYAVRDADGVLKSYMKTVGVYYDPSTDRLVTKDIVSTGGSVTLIGRIVNTDLDGNGRIAVADGSADIRIKNESTTAIALGEILNNDVKGSVVIVDMLRTDPQDADAPMKTTFTAAGGKEQEYRPATNAVYSWTDGTQTTEVTTFTNDHKEFLDIDFIDSDKYKENTVETGPVKYAGDDLKPGAYTVTDDTFDRTKGVYRIVGDNVEMYNTRSDVTRTVEWHGLNKHYIDTWTETTGKKQIYVHTLLADSPISVGFFGTDCGSIDVDSVGGVIFTGEVRNHTADSTLGVTSTGGSILQTGDFVIRGNNFSFRAKGDIGLTNLTALATADGKPITLSAVSEAGNVSVTTHGADVSLQNLAAGVGSGLSADSYGRGNVNLMTEGNVVMDGAAGSYGVKGSRIDITATGAVGTADAALIVQAGQTAAGDDPLTASLNVKAQNHINVEQQKGDLRVGRVESARGDVTLTAADGRILDALPEAEVTPTGDDLAEKVKRWADMGAIADSEVSPGYVGTSTKASQRSIADYEASVRTAWDQYEARKDYYSVPANRNDADQNYQIYKALDEKFSGCSGPEDFLAAQRKDPTSRYSTLLNVSAAPWTKEMMLYTLRDSVVNKRTGSTDTTGKLANIVGNDITLKSAKGIGSAGLGQETIEMAWLQYGYVDPETGLTNIDYLKELANINDSDITVNRDAHGNIVSFTVDPKAPVGVYGRTNKYGDDGALLDADSVTVKDGAAVGAYDIYVASRAKSASENARLLAVGQIRTNGGGDVRIFGKEGVVGRGDTFNVIGRDLLIEGGNGAVGGDLKGDTPLYTGLSGTLTARALGNISVQNYLTDAEGTAKPFVPDAKDYFRGDVSRFQTLGIGAVYTPGEVSLAGYKNIIMGENADAIAYINAGERVILTTFADGGAIGTQNRPIRILANGSAVSAIAANGNGNAYLDFVEPCLDDLDVLMGTPRLGRVRAKELHVRSVNGLTQTDEGIWADLLRVRADGHVTLTSRNNRFGRFLGASRLGGRLNGNFHVSALAGDRYRTWMMGPGFSWQLDGRFSQEWFEWLIARLDRFEADMMLRLDHPMRLDRGPVFFTGGDLLAYYRGRAAEIESEDGTGNATVDEIVVET